MYCLTVGRRYNVRQPSYLYTMKDKGYIGNYMEKKKIKFMDKNYKIVDIISIAFIFLCIGMILTYSHYIGFDYEDNNQILDMFEISDCREYNWHNQIFTSNAFGYGNIAFPIPKGVNSCKMFYNDNIIYCFKDENWENESRNDFEKYWRVDYA